jgi:hypothetical protein
MRCRKQRGPPPHTTDCNVSIARNACRKLSENFSQIVLRITDSTYGEIEEAGTASASGCDSGLLKSSYGAMRHKLKGNLERCTGFAELALYMSACTNVPGPFPASVKNAHFP